MPSLYPPFGPLVCVVGFHHHRGPEIESWYGVPPGTDPAIENDWSYLPFMALADGAHASTEDFSYFTLKRKLEDTPRSSNVSSTSQSSTHGSASSSQPSETSVAPSPEPPSSPTVITSIPEIVAPNPRDPTKELLNKQSSADNTPTGSRMATPMPTRARYGAGASVFAMSCTRQLDAKELLNRPADVTRSTVQKSVVLLLGSRPGRFAGWRDKLGAVTRAWFMQRDFEDREILKHFQESLVESEKNNEDEPDHFLGISLRQFVHDFRYQALVLFKCALLESKMLFFGAKCEKICMIQFALISLIPGLIRHLEDCADPLLDSYAENAFTPTSLRTSDRNSLLEYMGLPLQIFGRGSFFGPYTPLQQLDLLSERTTKSYIIGSTNTLLLQHKEGGPEVVCDVDEKTVTIYSHSLRTVLNLTAADRRWIDGIYHTILPNWDPEYPSQPLDHGYLGSEDFIRFQFEEYVLALLSATKYQAFFYAIPHKRRDLSAFPEIDGDPTNDFGDPWLDIWKMTSNYALWNRFTDSHLFDIVDPKHPTAGGLSVDDIQRRFAQQVSDLHLDTRVAAGREVLGKHLASGQKRFSSAFSSLWADIETRRAIARDKSTSTSPISEVPEHPAPTPSPYMETAALRANQASAVAAAAGQRASAYLSGWGAWASEKRRGWGRTASTANLKDTAGAQAAASDTKSTRNEKGLVISTNGEDQYGEVETPEGGQTTLWEAGAETPGGSMSSPKSPSMNSIAGSMKSPHRLKRMSTRLSNRSPKSKERIIDGIGRIDA